MDILKALLQALWQQDFETADPTLVWAIYGVLFMILFLENGLLPAAFLPGDSLLILVGVLIAKGTMNFPLTLFILTTAASPRLLGQLYSGQMAGQYAYGAKVAVAPARAVPSARAPVVSPPRPLGAVNRPLYRFCAHAAADHRRSFRSQQYPFSVLQLDERLSVGVDFDGNGLALGKTPIFRRYEDELMFCLMLLPLVLLVVGLFDRCWCCGVNAVPTATKRSVMMRWLQPLLRQPLRWLLAGLLAILAFAIVPALFRHENALLIRAAHQGVTLPDGFTSGSSSTP